MVTFVAGGERTTNRVSVVLQMLERPVASRHRNYIIELPKIDTKAFC